MRHIIIWFWWPIFWCYCTVLSPESEAGAGASLSHPHLSITNKHRRHQWLQFRISHPWGKAASKQMLQFTKSKDSDSWWQLPAGSSSTASAFNYIYSINHTSIKECLSENNLNMLKPLLVLTPQVRCWLQLSAGSNAEKATTIEGCHRTRCTFSRHVHRCQSSHTHNQTPGTRLNFNTVNSTFPQTQQSLLS